MSQFRVEKARAEAEVTLTTGGAVRGTFFLAGASATHAGPERVADLLNAETGFFPFETTGGDATTLLINRAQVVTVRLLDRADEPQLDPGYGLATKRHVAMLFTSGETLSGTVRVYRPRGSDRLSDYARSANTFRYLENEQGTFIVNSAHIVNFREVAE